MLSAVPWRGDPMRDQGLPRELLERPVLEVARKLLGFRLISTIGGKMTMGVIVETEAYGGPQDPASHAATVQGLTARNRAMFGPAGYAYVYRSYGIHWCLNIVTGSRGVPQAVLIRGIEPLEGERYMVERRGATKLLAAGPGRLCEAFGITGELYGHDLRRDPLVLKAGWSVNDKAVGISRRVGVTAAADWPYRFYVGGSSGVSRPDDWGSIKEAVTG